MKFMVSIWNWYQPRKVEILLFPVANTLSSNPSGMVSVSNDQSYMCQHMLFPVAHSLSSNPSGMISVSNDQASVPSHQ